jgi:hypothetical protein
VLTVDEVTEIFYLSDEFSKEFAMTSKKHQCMGIHIIEIGGNTFYD